MEPRRQVEIQLGHMCNNRCVFCVSGQRTAMGEAGPMGVAPILERIREARAQGHEKITLLGGEPTLQPGFLTILRETVALGFSEVVIFTNGAKTAREGFVEEILETGGNFTFRISIQGATRESHERTTKKPGSFGRILRTMEHLHARGQRITVNMCVVRSNFEEVDRFPALLAPFGASQLHLDMVRPRDAGVRSEEELRAMLPRYSDLAAPFRALVRNAEALAPELDLNLGNLPFCVAPELAPYIHHDGEHTETIAVDHDDRLSKPWNKYLVKREDKIKAEGCARCVFFERCNGVFEDYARFHGLAELVPVDPARLAEADPERKLLALHLRPLVRALGRALPDGPIEAAEARILGEDRLELRLRGEGSALALVLRPPKEIADAGFRYESFCGSVTFSEGDSAGRLADHAGQLLARLGQRAIHPVGADRVPGGPAHPRVGAALRRLREAAPFGALGWEALRVREDGQRAALALRGAGVALELFFELDAGGVPHAGYALVGDEAPGPEAKAAIAEGIGAALRALRGRAAGARRRGRTELEI